MLSIDDLLGDGSRQSVEDQSEEEGGDEEDEGGDDVLLVVLPDEVKEALEGVHKPRERRVWAVWFLQRFWFLAGSTNRVFLRLL